MNFIKKILGLLLYIISAFSSIAFVFATYGAIGRFLCDYKILDCPVHPTPLMAMIPPWWAEFPGLFVFLAVAIVSFWAGKKLRE